MFPQTLPRPIALARRKVVTIRGLDDQVTDGDQAVTVVVGGAESADGRYAGLYAGPYVVTNNDNDFPSLVVTAGEVGRPLHHSEGSSTSFSVRLATRPTTAVRVPIASRDTTEGAIAGGLAELVFQPGQWNIDQVMRSGLRLGARFVRA